jgi:CRP/FNR family cyclic AMP-dependent transcriptional regulator
MTSNELNLSAQLKDVLARSPLAVLPPVLLDRLLTDAQRIDVPMNTTVYDAGDDPRCALILSGLIRVYMVAPDGRQVTVRYARSTELLGLAALIGGPAPTSAQMLTDAKLLLLNSRLLQSMGQSEPRVGWVMAREITQRLYDTLDALAANTFGSLRQRMARHLLDLAASSQRASPLVAAISQQELADAVGSVRSVVARILRDLRTDGLIETTKDGITLLDPEALAAETWAESL